jgi:hypothetical protein
MPYFMRHGETDERRRVGIRLLCKPPDAIREHGRKLPFADRRVHERVTELQVAVGRWQRRQLHEPHGQLRCAELCVAQHLIVGRGRISADEPACIDTGGSQGRGRNTRSDHLIRRGYYSRVVQAHPQMPPAFPAGIRGGSATEVVLTRNRRSVI